ncbi:MAG: synthase subunit [Phycisphaerales bacterium]|nr:synthase subunit [Phycisphaerales bacterium]
MLKHLMWALTLTLLLAVPAARSVAADETHPTSAGVAADSHHDGADASHEKPALIPDLSKAATWWSAFWVIAIFLIVLMLLYPTAWKNVLAGLKAREQRIRTDIAEAESARSKAEATLREYTAQIAAAEQRVRDMITAATADGERMATQIRTRGEQEAQEIKERTTHEIEQAKKQAIAEIYDQAAILATSVAEKILRRNLNPDDQRDLVSRSLDQVQNIKDN